MIQLPKVYAIIDTATLARLDADPVCCAQAMLDAGIRLVQFRHKGHFTRLIYEQARQVASLCRQANAIYILDDRCDIASLVEAGVHLGQDDLPPADARRILNTGALIGHSTHNAQQLAAADSEPVDYLAIGPIFSTTSKANPDPVLGLSSVSSLRKLTSKPLVAIGGITLSSAAELWSAGIDSVAIISALLGGGPSSESIRKHSVEWLRAAGDML